MPAVTVENLLPLAQVLGTTCEVSPLGPAALRIQARAAAVDELEEEAVSW
jgi:hypothetical protein